MEQHRKPQALDCLARDFLTFRSMVIDLAAFLDRIDRYEGLEAAKGDYRYKALLASLDRAASGGLGRAEDILKLLSDPTREPGMDAIPPTKAVGAWRSGSGAD